MQGNKIALKYKRICWTTVKQVVEENKNTKEVEPKRKEIFVQQVNVIEVTWIV